jgi:glycerophosphoryl diester phosphodiesterase
MDTRAGVSTDTRLAVKRVGHKGAAALAPGNTLASFDAAVHVGVEMIEFDVLPERHDGAGELFLAHDYQSLRSAHPPLTLAEALDHLRGDRFASVEFDVDLKLPGYGARVLDALRATGLTDRALVTCAHADELDTLRALEPALRLGVSVPRAKRDYTADALTAVPALALLSGYRLLLPARMRRALRAQRVDVVTAHWRVVSPALVRAVSQERGELYVWTVNDPALMERLIAMGVHGVITDDPTLFARVPLAD